jgi:formate/nitrite transporter FocA (FNT family)
MPIETSRPNAQEIFKEVVRDARDELQRSTRALAFSGLAGGITIGLTPLAVAAVRVLLPANTPAADLIPYLFYPIGFIALIIGRAQLFTENTLYPVVLVLDERRYLRNTLRLWGTVFIANVAGALVFALLAVRTSGIEPKILDEMVKAGMLMVAPSSAAVFWSGVFAGWIIALVAWMVSASQWTIGQIIVVWLLMFVVGIARLAHCVAISAEILCSVVAGPVPVFTYLRWLFFAAAGNIVGGVGIVSLLNWGQVKADKEELLEKKREEAPRRAA